MNITNVKQFNSARALGDLLSYLYVIYSDNPLWDHLEEAGKEWELCDGCENAKCECVCDDDYKYNRSVYDDESSFEVE